MCFHLIINYSIGMGSDDDDALIQYLLLIQYELLLFN